MMTTFKNWYPARLSLQGFLLISFFCISLSQLGAQEKVGMKYDINGEPFLNYFDPLIYSPKNAITKKIYSNSFEIGYYYNAAGEKINGFIKFKEKKILFKNTPNGQPKYIKAANATKLVIGVDSFFSISNFYYQNTLQSHQAFVHYICSFNDYTVVQHYHFRLFTAQGQDPIIKSYLIKHKDDDVWMNFKNDGSFKADALKYFGHIPGVKEKITKGKYKKKDLYKLIKLAEYHYKNEHQLPVYFDKYWQETSNKEKACYQVAINHATDTSWIFSFHKGKIKVYDVHYSSLFPNVKHGIFKAYYPNGTIRLEQLYHKGEVKNVKHYTNSGSLAVHYNYTKVPKENTAEKTIQRNYLTVLSDNNNLIDSINFTYEYVDASGQIYTQQFKDKKLVNAFLVKDNLMYHQPTDPNYDYNISKIKGRFQQFMSNQQYDNAMAENAQGTILVRVLIDNRGEIIEYELIAGLHKELDNLVEKFIITNMNRIGFPLLKPYKISSIAQAAELIIPFTFTIDRFYRPPVHYNHLHHLQMQQMRQMQQFKAPPPPRMNYRF